MIQQPSRGSDDQVDSLYESIGLSLSVGSSHHDSKRLRVMLHQLFGDSEDLKSKLSSGGDDDDSGTCEEAKREAKEGKRKVSSR